MMPLPSGAHLPASTSEQQLLSMALGPWLAHGLGKALLLGKEWLLRQGWLLVGEV